MSADKGFPNLVLAVSIISCLVGVIGAVVNPVFSRDKEVAVQLAQVISRNEELLRRVDKLDNYIASLNDRVNDQSRLLSGTRDALSPNVGNVPRIR